MAGWLAFAFRTGSISRRADFNTSFQHPHQSVSKFHLTPIIHLDQSELISDT
jgi:hypothetical protein